MKSLGESHRVDSREPRAMVGIVFMVEGKLWIDATPADEAAAYGTCKTHERGHLEYWCALRTSGRVPDAEYEEFPRGRVVYNTNTCEFIAYLDKCILRKHAVVNQLMRRLNLPPARTRTLPDSHYRCFKRLRRSGGSDG